MINTEDEIYFGPTAVPAFSRENYSGLRGLNLPDMTKISALLCIQYLANRDGFRRLAWQEGRRYFKYWFTQAVRAIVPSLEPQNLIPSDKIGIRAQMYQYSTKKLVDDFVIEKGENSTHILNSISPAWTCSFPVAEMIIKDL
jgi:L-2-hydroxyglutarate oxidase LhgO